MNRLFKKQALTNWADVKESCHTEQLGSVVNLVCLTSSIELKLAHSRAKQTKARRRMQHAFRN
jgi:hypothetical protein